MFPKNTRLIFSFRKIGNGPGTVKSGVPSFGIHFMKFSTLKVFPGSSVNFVVMPSSTQVSTRTMLSPLPRWAAIKNLVAHPQILAMQPKPETEDDDEEEEEEEDESNDSFEDGDIDVSDN